MNVIFYLSYDPKTTFKSHFLHENAKILPRICHVIMAINTVMLLPKSVSILMHGSISLPDATSYDKSI